MTSCLLNPAIAWEARDQFDHYPPGSDAAPTWDAGSINWEGQEKRFVAYYHYALAKPGDTVGGPGVPDYYLPIAAWRDQATGKQYGVVALNRRDFHCSFWLDEHGQHPDAWRAVDQDLAPGARFADPLLEPISFAA